MSKVDVVPIVRNVVSSSVPAAEAKRVEIACDAPESAVIRADPNRLQQIVWNLVSNAVKFSLPDGRVNVQVEADEGRVVIRVRDDGIGIPADVLPHVFERFWQADSTPDRAHGGPGPGLALVQHTARSAPARPHGGLGLGLPIVKQIAELHGGAVKAESPGPGRGATFTITLPAAGRAEARPTLGAGDGKM